MHWLEVDGLSLPVRLGGHAALDFCNTWAGWGEPPDPRREWLRTYDHLAVWAGHAELLGSDDVRRLRRGAARDPHGARAVLAAARGLRTSGHAAVLEPADAKAAAVITRYVRRAGATVRLEAADQPRWTFPREVGLELPVLAVAWSFGDLLTHGDLGRIKACPGHDCGWLFLDTSGRRRWCSMSSCGNRAKVNAFARRQKKHQPPR